MNVQEILHALQAREISPKDAEKKLAKETVKTLEQSGDNDCNDLVYVKENKNHFIKPENLGNPIFQQRYRCKWNYYAGSMYRGISSEQMIIAMGNSNLLSVFGSAGFSAKELEPRIKKIQSQLGPNKPYGMCLICNLNDPEEERQQAELFLKYNIPVIEAAAYSGLTIPLVYCRVKGLYQNGDKIVIPRRIIGKCSRLEIARLFLSPPPIDIVKYLLKFNAISEEEAILSQRIPMADDLAIEADSGGHTDQGVSFALIPPTILLREKMKRKFNYEEEILIGCGGGIGTPEAVAAAFMLGADFIFTGSINQCTIESGAHDVIKEILSKISVHDTTITKAGDMFEIGANVQIVKKNTQFPARANNLYRLFMQYNSIEDIPSSTRRDIETNYFKKTFSEVWGLICEYKNRKNPEQINEANENPRIKMALILKWYFAHCNQITLDGDISESDNFLIYTGPALGSFNEWVKGTEFEHWKNRQVVKITNLLMLKACEYIETKQYHENILKNQITYRDKFSTNINLTFNNDNYEDCSIAVIGVSGQFPRSNTLGLFWDNICNGVNCISEIPPIRWSIDQYYDSNPDVPGKTNSKWMGVLDDADKFDPMFFNISPAEAEFMDPQQRLFLENCWSCIEDAGLSPSALSGIRCGVFVGCGANDYGQYVSGERLNAYNLMGKSASILSSRISYILNLKGPSIAIDTACSSSLVAIAEACNSLILKTTDLALAGGVSVLPGPSIHIMAGKAGMLSENGKCYTFDNRANGFVPAEGVGVVLLKRLSDAILDKDPIYGVIRGWGVNQDGKTNGITAPSVNSQIHLEKEVYQRFNINPETISLVEAHGTGTKLGDPIEVEALTESFRSFTNKNKYCALGSVKSNIGHSLASAGVAGVIKVLLALKYRMLPPTINFETLNEHIDLVNSPFYINTELKPWEVTRGMPRRASVSSFGFSGTNAHIIIEEYHANIESDVSVVQINKSNPMLFVLSAKSKEQLKVYADCIKSYIESNEELNLADIAYTLQVGREAMDNRLAFLANSRTELLKKLKTFINDESLVGVIYAQLKKNKDGLVAFEADEDIKILLKTWIQKRKLDKVAELWSKGFTIDWNMIYGDTKPRRISLPTYPFAKERYWRPEIGSGIGGYPSTNPNLSIQIHPLLHQNTSNLYEQRFSSVFTGQEFFLNHHFVNGRQRLPGVLCLEMARAAVEQAMDTFENGKIGIMLNNVVWNYPIVVMEDKPVHLHIALFPADNGQISYEIYSELEDLNQELIVHSSGIIKFNSLSEVPVLDIKALQMECSQRTLSSDQCYEALRKKGIDCGPGLQGIETVFVGVGQVLAKLAIPSLVIDSLNEFVMHPCLMESALQAAIGIMMGANNTETFESCPIKTVQPLALQELEIIGKHSVTMWALIRYSENSTETDTNTKLDISLCDETGAICSQIKAIEMQENLEIVNNHSLQSNSSLPEKQEACEIMTFEEVWHEQPVVEDSSIEFRTIVCFLSLLENQQEFVKTIGSLARQTKVIFISQSTVYQKHSERVYSISPTKQTDYSEAFRSISEDYGEVDEVLYLWALEDSRCIKDISSIVYILQAFADTKVKPMRLLLAGEYENGLDRCYLESWIGFERSIGMAMLNIHVTPVYREVCTNKRENALNDWGRIIWSELHSQNFQSVLYKDEKRHVYQIRSTNLLPGTYLLKPAGTYLITGGCGGLGLLFAKHFAKTQAVNLILTGRSPINEDIQAIIKELENLGSQVLYIQADVCDQIAMIKGLHRAKERFGGVRGVIHAAGIQGHESILEKGMESFQTVLDPKIKGTLVLDELLDNEPLDFICYFSSSSAILGDIGSCDYAIGNRFQTAYAHYRNQMALQGQCRGKAIAINWPLWKDGGMGLNDVDNSKMYLKSSGQRFLEAEEGVAVFNRILVQGIEQQLVLVGQPSRVYSFLGLVQDQSFAGLSLNISNCSNTGKKRSIQMKGLSLEQCLEWDMKEFISKLMKISRDRLDKEENLVEYGFDSISLAKFATLLTNHYGIEITPSLFFGHSTLERIIQYFLKEHHEAIQEFYRDETTVHTISETHQHVPDAPRLQRPNFIMRGASLRYQEPIAIIGMSGRLPGARNIDEMWSILVKGQDVVQEIPNDRLDYYSRYCENWGNLKCGWIPGVSEFDPLFFEISPREAETMDPRQRLLLQEAWKGLEDAGYGPRLIGTSKTGMFVGVEQGDYYSLSKETSSITSNHDAVLAARLPYLLNLSGPVMVINTACSSGLVAAHQACQSLRNYECDTAIAAGVNILLTSEPYIKMRQAGMLSENGKCFAFDKRADGIVPGEAVVVVVLKRLSQAIADGDAIHAVIKGSGINYDGKTNGITAPSGVAQTNLLQSIYDEYNINPQDIEYIVTHGTGTKLGDPVEINALYDAFKNYTKKQGYCAITSTKTNFGHTFAASGLVSLIGLVQSFVHETIPASLHCEQENNYINWQESPFYVNKTNRPWIESGEKSRMGAVSAFGMSGTNAHMVVQSYLIKEAQLPLIRAPFYLLAFSAKTQESLQEKIQDMIAMFEKEGFQDQSLANISYTLLDGRHHFTHRCAIVIQDKEDAVYLLKQIGGKEKLPNLFQGKVQQKFEGLRAIQEYAQDILRQSWSLHKNKEKYQETLVVLADIYCQGYELDWSVMYGDTKPRKIRIPTYPFAKQHYWIPKVNSKDKSVISPPGSQYIHPLLHKNMSNLYEQRFSSTFIGHEFFLADHIVMGERVLPGVAHLEMARAAVEQAAGLDEKSQTGIRLKNVVWSRPITVEQPVEVHIGLIPEENGEIFYEIYSDYAEAGTERVLNSQGRAILTAVVEATNLDIEATLNECTQSRLNAAQCYAAFKAMGLDYGPGFQGIEEINVGHDKLLAKICLPSSVSTTKNQFTLHPSLIDSALQAAIGLSLGSGDKSNIIRSKTVLPFALRELEIIRGCTETIWALVRYSDSSMHGDKIDKFNIELYDNQGRICAKIKEFAARVLEVEAGTAGSSVNAVLMLQPHWNEKSAGSMHIDYDEHLVLVCELDNINSESIKPQLDGVRCLTLQSQGKSIAERFMDYAIETFEEIQRIIKDKRHWGTLIQLLVPYQGDHQLLSGLKGILKTAHLENSKIIGQMIEVEQDEVPESIAEKLKENRRSPNDNEIRYQDGKRCVAGWSEIQSFSTTVSIPWKDRGIYLITGGAGGLGLIFAKEIATQVNEATLILTGRSSLDEDKKIQIERLHQLGAKIQYKQVDVTDKNAVNELLQDIIKDHGSINGIIHSAGLICDNYIVKKTKNEFKKVLAPKVTGVVNLDKASKDLNLDFFVFFSSAAGSLGNPGQADYASANAFMDAYARYRNSLVTKKQRQGRTIAINWPLWQEGGMCIDSETQKMILQNAGIIPMRTETGIWAFYTSLANSQDQVMVLEGDTFRIRKKLLSQIEQSIAKVRNFVESSLTTDIYPEDLLTLLETALIHTISAILKVRPEDIDPETELTEYGFDSIIFTELINRLNQQFQLELNPTIFFEYTTLRDFALYLIAEHQSAIGVQYTQPFKAAASVPVINRAASQNSVMVEEGESSSTTGIDSENLLTKLETSLTHTISAILKVRPEDIDPETELTEYGFDSIIFTELINRLNQQFQLELNPTIFFEYTTLRDFVLYLIAEHQPEISVQYTVSTQVAASVPVMKFEGSEKPLKRRNHTRFTKIAGLAKPESETSNAIAIIGVSGIFPKAKDVNEYWRNLVEGKDCITEIPKDRWDWREYYGDPSKEANKTNVKWGGFIDEVADFDPLFFGISPKEAELMDPQQRLTMTYVWKVIEDAGYAAGSLSGSNTGIFIGTGNSGYTSLFSRANIAIEGYTSIGMAPSVGPNRMSYFLNLHGPSEPIETACSSSLVAIHRAVSAIENGNCKMAIAGGVNTIVSPDAHISFTRAGMLCEDGRCKTFSSKANGYVRGEGVGMIVLKKLEDAERDGDHIYGLIRSTVVNHGGRAASLTAPNPKAQAELLVSAYKKADIDPRTVSYIEAHGTGTELGDPIEINGLKTAFKELYQTTGDIQVHSTHCGLGSVKTNIGHLELAAGIAGVIKVLLQLKHKKLVKSLHCSSVNPYIQLKGSPFYIVQENKDWLALKDIAGQDIPRRAGVSSFGFGGVNAHVVIEEYIPPKQKQPKITVDPHNPALIIMSAKNADCLKMQVQQLRTAIQEQQFSDSDLADVAYTLQVGREAMDERIAVIALSVNELADKLAGFIEGKTGIEGLYHGQTKQSKETLAAFAGDEDITKTIDAWFAKRKYSKLLDLWVKGLNFDWKRFYGEIKPCRISVPTYPFVRESYWVYPADTNSTTSSAIPSNNVQRKMYLLKKQWESAMVDPTPKHDGCILVITTQETMSLADQLCKYCSKARIFNVNDFELQHYQPNLEWHDYDGIVDLVGCGTYKNEELLGWIKWLQKLIDNKRSQGLTLLCVTKGLESYLNTSINLSGASRAGLYRMLQSEYNNLVSRHMDVDLSIDDIELAELILNELSNNTYENEICYRNGDRYRSYLEPTNDDVELNRAERTLIFPEDRVLCITGGTRGLGYLCAEHFVKNYSVKRLVLIGREKLPPREEWDSYTRENTSIAEKIRAVTILETYGAQVQVLSLNLVDEQAVRQTIQEIKSTHGPIGGIIHCAGISDAENPAFIRKPIDKIKQILAPKVMGLDVISRCLENEPLEFFVLFSSVSAIVPSLASGQSDYAMANAYMDYFAGGQTLKLPIISIQWPLWKETGMGKVRESKAYKQTGLLSQTNEEGLQLLDYILSKNIGPTILPVVVNKELWNPQKLMQRTIEQTSETTVPSRQHTALDSSISTESLEDAVQTWLISLFSEELKIDPLKLALDTPFHEYGMDSILLAQVIVKMEQKLEDTAIEPSALLEFPTLKSLTGYLTQAFPEAFSRIISGCSEKKTKARLNSNGQVPLIEPTKKEVPKEGKNFANEKVAIVGMACHFPEASNISEYWNNLKLGKDCIREIPKSRWDWEKYYDPQGFKDGKSICKQGGFLPDIEKFDPHYFKIPESLAPQIDPLQRQWLEVSAEALADAGYTKEDLWGKRVGVFVGARVGNFASKIGKIKNSAIVGTGQNFIAAYLAQIYNFKGPNMVIDTACSSSLTAIHLGVKSIQNNESEIVLAGGVDILLDESPFLVLSAAKILSPDGRCKTFDSEADGIGIGEGCGVLVLKSYKKAIQDNDKIYGIIEGTAINNDGYTMGITTPNPEVQQQLIEEAITDANINPETITYVETHGTGTLIGDPIELKGLTKVFNKFTSKKRFCGVGSVKSNIGHLLCAAGAASIIKVLLAITHKELPPTLHCNKPNPRFNFDKSPLFPVQNLIKWTTGDNVLRAGISAFGLGGNNAHIIVSNEGIPDSCRPTLIPKGEKVVFNRQRYWPEELNTDQTEENDDKGFLEIFNIMEVTNE